MAGAGYSSVRWDKRGYGTTPAAAHPLNDEDEAEDLIAAITYARSGGFQKVAVLGEDKGAYFAGLAAMIGTPADAYVFLGTLCGSNAKLFEYNYGKLWRYAGRSEENRAWAEAVCPKALAIGKHYLEILRAAETGQDYYRIDDGPVRCDYRLERLKFELKYTPQRLFTYIRSPSLVLHGERDMNVPPEEAADTETILRRYGKDVSRYVIPEADHNAQIAPADYEKRLRERYSFESFNNPYSEDFYKVLTAWLHEKMPA